MRHRRGLGVLATLALLLIAAAMTAPYTLGFTGPRLAGRPIRDDAQEMQCQGIAYARVGGAIVLLTAHHCREYADYTGGPKYYHNINTGVRTNGDVLIGFWGPGLGTGGDSWADNDLTFITLLPEFIPATGRNQVYRGEVPGDNFWTITTNPTAADGCAGFPAGGAFPDTTYHNYQGWKDSTTPYRTGSVIAFVNGSGQQSQTDPNMPNDTCNLQTNLTKHGFSDGNGADSGSPVIRFSDQTTVNGIMTGHWNNKLYFNPLYEGLDDLNTYYVNLNGTGAWLCQTSTC